MLAAFVCLLPVVRSIPGALIPAFGIMGLVLAPVLAWR